MIIEPVDTAQSLTFYIRPMVNTSNSYRIELTNESTGDTQTITPTLTASDTYERTFSCTFSGLTEGTFYALKLYEYNSGNVKRLFYDRVFCTAQTDFDKYYINSGEYTEYDAGADSREYITY